MNDRMECQARFDRRRRHEGASVWIGKWDLVDGPGMMEMMVWKDSKRWCRQRTLAGWMDGLKLCYAARVGTPAAAAEGPAIAAGDEMME
ncbi:hypothetical protein Dda_0743 [Drechslerella dactyloides]|uniref:Uncharacterized protein n=1 Tax=Drechslerella dactyloides TaxID=74499 RepID=A0AAD6NMX5_DREDA|nr:hypothetical protein Dda_0743 [Drechslerella dactyloides]